MNTRKLDLSTRKHQEKKMHKLYLNEDRLGLFLTQGGRTFQREIEAG